MRCFVPAYVTGEHSLLLWTLQLAKAPLHHRRRRATQFNILSTLPNQSVVTRLVQVTLTPCSSLLLHLLLAVTSLIQTSNYSTLRHVRMYFTISIALIAPKLFSALQTWTRPLALNPALHFMLFNFLTRCFERPGPNMGQQRKFVDGVCLRFSLEDAVGMIGMIVPFRKAFGVARVVWQRICDRERSGAGHQGTAST